MKKVGLAWERPPFFGYVFFALLTILSIVTCAGAQQTHITHAQALTRAKQLV